MILDFIVNGQVQPKQSARFTRCGGFIRSYQPKKVIDYANTVRFAFLQKYPDFEPIKDRAVEVKIKVFVEVPQSKSKKFKNAALLGEIRPTKKPDCDNIAKNINDALNGIAYVDDAQIVKETIEKWYAATPQVEITIKI